MNTNHILISVNTQGIEYAELAAYIRTIAIFKEWKTDVSPFDIDAREYDNRWLLSVIYNGKKCVLSLISNTEFAGYGDDGYHITLVGNVVEFVEKIKETFKYM